MNLPQLPKVRFGPRTPEDPAVRIRLSVLAKTTTDELTQICRAITAIWTLHCGDPIDFEVVIAEHFAEENGPVETNSTSYITGRWTILIGMQQLRAWMPEVRLDARLALVSAHETMHAVQDARGQLPRDPKGRAEYALAHRGHRCEIEAWNESVDLLRALYPEAEGSFDAGHGCTHTIPNKSRYADLIEGLLFMYEVTSELPEGLSHG